MGSRRQGQAQPLQDGDVRKVTEGRGCRLLRRRRKSRALRRSSPYNTGMFSSSFCSGWACPCLRDPTRSSFCSGWACPCLRDPTRSSFCSGWACPCLRDPTRTIALKLTPIGDTPISISPFVFALGLRIATVLPWIGFVVIPCGGLLRIRRRVLFMNPGAGI
jgi:hypothetical protein